MRVGPLIASGRDCDIFDAGAGRVIRRARDGRSLEQEASVMRHARRHGFPAAHVVDADGPDMLMERIDGPNLAQDASRRPWRLWAHARLLAALLRQLAEVRAPGWLPAAQGCPGVSLLHLDLHPFNVLLCAEGPRVIDWANASRGAPGADVANTWLALAATPMPDPVRGAGRWLMLRAFLDGVDRRQASAHLAAVGGWRLADRNTSRAERARIGRIVAREAGG